jgi:7,8-dihydropterin-6-yl-methyl-4-(beta-D-ribofuranosyl)aminobenzene 5'-phosphate synthase
MGSGVSVVERTYALVGGFHLAPASDDYLRQVEIPPRAVMQMRCSGQNFVDLANKEMPEKLALCGTASNFTFTA